jgi:hypothetical protein
LDNKKSENEIKKFMDIREKERRADPKVKYAMKMEADWK